MIISLKVVMKTWLKSFSATFFAMFLLITSGSIVVNLMRSTVTAYEVFIFQLLSFPETLMRILATSCLLGSLLSINQLIKTNQLVAIYSLGFSPRKITQTLSFLGMAAACVFFLTSGFIKPWGIQQKNRYAPNLGKKFTTLKKEGLITSKATQGKMWLRDGNKIISYVNFNGEKHQLNNVTIFERDEQHQLKKFQYTEKANYNNGKWIGENSIVVNNIQKDKKEKAFIKQGINQNLDQTPKNFKKLEQDLSSLNFNQITKYIETLEQAGINASKYLLINLSSVAGAVNCLVFALFGVLLVQSPNKRNQSTGVLISGSLVFIILYWLTESYLSELVREQKMNVYLGAFLPPALVLTAIFSKAKMTKKS